MQAQGFREAQAALDRMAREREREDREKRVEKFVEENLAVNREEILGKIDRTSKLGGTEIDYRVKAHTVDINGTGALLDKLRIEFMALGYGTSRYAGSLTIRLVSLQLH